MNTIIATIFYSELIDFTPISADFYLNTDRSQEQELYYEAYDTVAVMFASLTELSMDESHLSEKNILVTLNRIICEFDKLLFEPNFLRIEKIKVAGEWCENTESLQYLRLLLQA